MFGALNFCALEELYHDIGTLTRRKDAVSNEIGGISFKKVPGDTG